MTKIVQSKKPNKHVIWKIINSLLQCAKLNVNSAITFLKKLKKRVIKKRDGIGDIYISS